MTCLTIERNKLFILITYIMTAIMACSSSETFTVLEYESGAESKLPKKVPLVQRLEPGAVLNLIVSTTSATCIDIRDIKQNVVMRIAPKITSIAFNSYIGGWGVQEDTSNIPIRIDAGVKYNMHIVYQLGGYRLFVNGEEAHFYKHRNELPGMYIDMSYAGQCFFFSHKLNEPKWAVEQSNNTMYIREFSDAGKESPQEIQFQGKNQLSSVVITGIINSNADNVVFSLLDSCDEEVFSFDIRLQDNYVVRNSFIQGVWGKEERNGAMVFQKNKRFTLAIDVEDEFYKIYVDGLEFVTYKHRASPNNITKFSISAGMKIFKIIYQK